LKCAKFGDLPPRRKTLAQLAMAAPLVCDLAQFRRGQKGAVREDDAFAQETDRAQVVGTRAAVLSGDTFDLTAALRQMHGNQQIAFARDPIDRSQEVGCAGIGCMRTEHDADATTRPFVVVGERPLEGSQTRIAFEAALGGGGDSRILDLRCGRKKVGAAIEPQPPLAGEVEDCPLPRPELIDERRRTTFHDLKQTEGNQGFELGVVEIGHG
jgi:hypothetical protein